jgi:heme-degrading monooxygenase HmoA
MIGVIFEVWPAPGRRDEYLDIAARLKADLEQFDGFVSIERFQSLTDPNKLLSLQFWRDEASLARWRNHEPRRAAQRHGRAGVFDDYRLRVVSVLRDYGAFDRREQAPADSRAAHEAGRRP